MTTQEKLVKRKFSIIKTVLKNLLSFYKNGRFKISLPNDLFKPYLIKMIQQISVPVA